jgi:hypothetical protein
MIYKDEIYKLREYKGKKFKTGSIWKTASDGFVTIVGNLDKKYREVNKWFLCKFEDGTIVVAEMKAIEGGKISNPNKPRVHGVGFVGQGKYKGYTKGNVKTKEYGIWEAMLNRCYGKQHYYNLSVRLTISC